MTKYCPKCHKDLPTTSFYKDVKKPDGLYYICKYCRAKYINKWRSKRKLWQDGLDASIAESFLHKQS